LFLILLFTSSTDGGQTFENIEYLLQKEAVRANYGVFKSPVDKKRVSSSV